MTKTSKTILWIVIAIIVIGGIWYGVSRKPVEKVIKIGAIMPLSGGAASYGDYVRKALVLGVEDFNNQSKDIKFEVIYEDGKCDPKEAVTAINKLISIDQVKYIFGGFCSGETLAAAPIAESNKIILLSSGSGSPDITKAGDYIFRNFISDDYTAKALAKLALEKGDKQIALITENTDYPQTLKKAFIAYYESKGGKVLMDETFTAENLDFRTTITKAKNQNVANVMIVVQSYKHSAPLLKQMKELGFSPKIYTTESVISAEALSFYDVGYKDLLEGAMFVEPKFDETNPKAVTLLAEYKARHGTTEGPVPPFYLATYYDAPFLLGEAIRKAGDDPTKVKNYFYTIKDWDGTVGKFSFDENGDALTEVAIKTVSNGQMVPSER